MAGHIERRERLVLFLGYFCTLGDPAGVGRKFDYIFATNWQGYEVSVVTGDSPGFASLLAPCGPG